jgi:hypothetical protein
VSTWEGTWELRGTDRQRSLALSALSRCDFPWDRLTHRPIPVDWADLSAERGARAHDDGPEVLAHEHVTDPETGDVGHAVVVRHRVLGLAWYSGRVTLDVSLEDDAELAAEVLLAEAAHMVDFFGMTDRQRVAVWNAVHPPEQHVAPGTSLADGVDLGHGHGWFDVATYGEWVGEEFMGLFCAAFSDVVPTIPFAHTWDADAALQVRTALLGPEVACYGKRGSAVFHDAHRGVPAEVTFVSRADALAAGRRPCGVCRP